MPRKPRSQSSSGIYHIMLRGINRQTIFEDDGDRYRFLETLKKYKNISKYHLYSYCLMDNHVHLLVKETEDALSQAIQRISSSYVHWYNNKYERSGHLFQERFKSEPVENHAYFITVLRYIHQNPVKAGVAGHVSKAKWTSYHEYTHQNQAEMIDIDVALHLFSPNRSQAIPSFTQYMQEQNEDQCMDDRPKVKMSDREVIDRLHHCGIENISKFQQMEKETRDAFLLQCKRMNGVTVRQLSRVTGISKSVIDRIR